MKLRSGKTYTFNESFSKPNGNHKKRNSNYNENINYSLFNNIISYIISYLNLLIIYIIIICCIQNHNFIVQNVSKISKLIEHLYYTHMFPYLYDINFKDELFTTFKLPDDNQTYYEFDDDFGYNLLDM